MFGIFAVLLSFSVGIQGTLSKVYSTGASIILSWLCFVCLAGGEGWPAIIGLIIGLSAFINGLYQYDLACKQHHKEEAQSQ